MGTSATTGLLVIDTDVLIDYLRDQPEAVEFLESSDQLLATSVVTIAELYVGVRQGEERQRLDGFVSAFEALPLGAPAAIQTGLWRRQHGPSHGTGLADALNRRHFPMLANVLVPSAKG